MKLCALQTTCSFFLLYLGSKKLKFSTKVFNWTQQYCEPQICAYVQRREETSRGAVLRLGARIAFAKELGSQDCRQLPSELAQPGAKDSCTERLHMSPGLPSQEPYPSPPALHIQGNPSKIAGFQKNKRLNVGFPNQRNQG